MLNGTCFFRQGTPTPPSWNTIIDQTSPDPNKDTEVQDPRTDSSLHPGLLPVGHTQHRFTPS